MGIRENFKKYGPSIVAVAMAAQTFLGTPSLANAAEENNGPWRGSSKNVTVGNIFRAPLQLGWSVSGDDSFIDTGSKNMIKVEKGIAILNISTGDKKTVVPGTGLGADGKLVTGYAIDAEGNEVPAIALADLIETKGSGWEDRLVSGMFDRAIRMAEYGFGYKLSNAMIPNGTMTWPEAFKKEQEMRLKKGTLKEPLFVTQGVTTKVVLKSGPTDPAKKLPMTAQPSLIPQ